MTIYENIKIRLVDRVTVYLYRSLGSESKKFKILEECSANFFNFFFY